MPHTHAHGPSLLGVLPLLGVPPNKLNLLQCNYTWSLPTEVLEWLPVPLTTGSKFLTTAYKALWLMYWAAQGPLGSLLHGGASAETIFGLAPFHRHPLVTFPDHPPSSYIPATLPSPVACSS